MADLGCATVFSFQPFWAWKPAKWRWAKPGLEMDGDEHGLGHLCSSPFTHQENSTARVSLTCWHIVGLMSQVEAPPGQVAMVMGNTNDHPWISPLLCLTTAPPEKGGEESDMYGTPSIHQAPAWTVYLHQSLLPPTGKTCEGRICVQYILAPSPSQGPWHRAGTL